MKKFQKNAFLKILVFTEYNLIIIILTREHCSTITWHDRRRLSFSAAPLLAAPPLLPVAGAMELMDPDRDLPPPGVVLLRRSSAARLFLSRKCKIYHTVNRLRSFLSLGHLVTRATQSLGHSVTQSLGHFHFHFHWLLCHSVILFQQC